MGNEGQKPESLQGQLQNALAQATEQLGCPLAVSSVPVYRVKTSAYVAYRSPLAEVLEKRFPASSRDWAMDLLHVLSDTSPWQVVRVFPHGLEFRYCESMLADWLNALLDMTISLPSLAPPVTGAYLPLQYLQCRCLSYLYLGQSEGFITLSPGEKSLLWQWETPSPLPWLQESETWRFVSPPAWEVLSQVVTVTDILAQGRPIPWPTVAYRFGKTIETFECVSCIGGTTSLELVQARLGLMAVAQRLLLRIFWEQFGIVPRLEF
ncbi:hypothetical protein PN462_01405 [Spirulina sp. CS-785/01]|uniref:hypothetical protein n=1 Tax=Spirulina sp. CS-785/01 TaxID=3021716 RepID=UPI00233089F0|nr:hypothetical protein [Spirulina sp. CS-785/01]MDB9311740.1 hypothetical protein [Spirulina sp. CS-785/01]